MWGGGRVDLWGLERMCEDVLGCLDWGMIVCICEDGLLKFVSDMIVEREFKKYFKDVKCKFTNLSLLLKIFK